jgi:hypothetical protein
VHGRHPVLEAREAARVLRDNVLLEVAIARHRDPQGAVVAEHRYPRVAIVVIGLTVTVRLPVAIANLIAQLVPHRPLKQTLLERDGRSLVAG